MNNPFTGLPINSAKLLDEILTKPAKQHKPLTQKQVRAKVKDLTKQIDRVRHQIERLEQSAPYSPALQRAKQFMAMNKITKISQTRYIKTAQQYQEYKRFLNKFERYDTRTLKGAREAEKKKLESLEDIMKANGWDPNKYDVNQLYDRLNKIDIYQVMTDFAITSDKIVASITHIMNTKQGKKVSAQQLLQDVFGSMPAADRYGRDVTKQQLTGYNKGTKPYKTGYNKKRKKGR